MNPSRVICRIGGGLGNQLFMYATAQALAWRTGSRLWFDTGVFQRDTVYRRQWLLHAFDGPAEVPVIRSNSGISWISRSLAMHLGTLIPNPVLKGCVESTPAAFQPSVLCTQAWRVYLAGCWQSESYFADYRSEILAALAIRNTLDATTRLIAGKIDSEEDAVAVHVRSYFDVRNPSMRRVVPIEFAERCCEAIARSKPNARFFLFADDPSRFPDLTNRLPRSEWVTHSHRQGNRGAICDLHLMSHCKHFVIANSSLSWWGAWLSQRRWGIANSSGCERLIYCPGEYMFNRDAVPQWWIDPTKKEEPT